MTLMRNDLMRSLLFVPMAAGAQAEAENALIPAAPASFDERARVVRAMSAESVAQPAIEPGSTRILISVSGTIQLQ